MMTKPTSHYQGIETLFKLESENKTPIKHSLAKHTQSIGTANKSNVQAKH